LIRLIYVGGGFLPPSFDFFGRCFLTSACDVGGIWKARGRPRSSRSFPSASSLSLCRGAWALPWLYHLLYCPRSEPT